MIKNKIGAFWQKWWTLIVFVLPVLACAPSSAGMMLSTDEVVPPDNFVIGGAPQWVGLTATPIPTHTQLPTSTSSSISIPAGGYITNTPYPGATSVCTFVFVNGIWVQTCSNVTNTPEFGGVFSTPAYSATGASATPRSTYTPYPSATPCFSFGDFYFGEYVYSQYSDSALNVRILLDNVNQSPIAEAGYSDRQLLVFDIEIQNRGSLEYVLFPQLQLFIAEVDETWGPWAISLEAADLASLDISIENLELLRVPSGETKSATFASIVPMGIVNKLGWIMDPTISQYQDRIVGGNVAYWIEGQRASSCSAGPISTQALVPTLPAPLPTASPTTYQAR